MKRHLTAAALAAFVALAALPAWAGPGLPWQPAVQEAGQQDVEARIRADLERAMADLRAELDEMRARLSEMSDERAWRFESLEPHFDAAFTEQELAQDMAERAREMAQDARVWSREMRFEPAGGAWNVWRGRGDYGASLLDHAEELGLSDDQEARIRDLQRAHEREAIARRADIEVAEMDLEALREEPDYDLAELRAGLERLSSLEIDGRLADLRLRRDSSDVLTAEQRARFDEIWGEREHRFSFTIRQPR